jgi:hypothetical protein
MTSEIKADKWSPASGTSATIGDSGDTYTIPSGVTFTNNGTANGFGITAANFRPNANPLIINGNMAVAQRGTSFTGVSSGPNFTADRFQFYLANLGTYTLIQEALTSGNAYDAGFKTAWRIDTTTADASPSAADYAILRYKFEGQDLQSIKKGTSNAEKLTLAFWVKSNKATTGSIDLFDYDNSRIVGATYTVNTANTWEKKIINIAADTTGAFANDNGLSLGIEWFLDTGSTYSGGTTPTAWEAQTNANRNVSNFALGDNTANDWAITGVQLEVGEYTSSTIPPFQHESYGDNLIRCQRYYEKSFEQGTTPTAGTSAPDGRVFASWDGASARTQIDFNTTKRASPTVTIYRGANAGSGTATGTANFIMELGGGGSANWYNHTCTSNHADDSQVSLTGSTSNFVANGGYVADLNFTADSEL